MIEFRHYPLSKPLVVNGGEFVELIISSQLRSKSWFLYDWWKNRAEKVKIIAETAGSVMIVTTLIASAIISAACKIM